MMIGVFNRVISYLNLLICFILIGCVGVIEDNNKVDDSSIVNSFSGSFDGVEDGIAISHDKVQLMFRPASGGSGDFSYVAYRDGNQSNVVASISGEQIEIDFNGYINLIVDDLPSAGNVHEFIVRAVDNVNSEQDTNNKFMVLNQSKILVELMVKLK